MPSHWSVLCPNNTFWLAETCWRVRDLSNYFRWVWVAVSIRVTNQCQKVTQAILPKQCDALLVVWTLDPFVIILMISLTFHKRWISSSYKLLKVGIKLLQASMWQKAWNRKSWSPFWSLSLENSSKNWATHSTPGHIETRFAISVSIRSFSPLHSHQSALCSQEFSKNTMKWIKSKKC